MASTTATDQFRDATGSVVARFRFVGVVFAAAVALVGLVLGLLTGPGPIVSIVPIVLGALVAGGWVLYANSVLSGAAGRLANASASGLVEGGASVEAFTNAVEGVGVMIGVSTPNVRLLPSEAANAAVTASGEEATLLVTTALVNSSGPAELEAIAAELLCRVRDGSAEYLTVCAAVPAPLRRLCGADDAAVGAVLGDQRSARADLDAISVTRYPPALISALERMEAEGTEVGGAHPDTAFLWMAPAIPGGGAGSPALDTAIQPIPYRTALLREL